MKSISTVFRGGSPGGAWFLVHLLLTWTFARAVCAHLGNFYPIGSDEVWIASASFKLANRGTLGSDLFVGLHDADQYYFLNLPVHHLLQASVFRIAGAGMIQARAVSVVGAIAVLWMVGWLAYRWYGLACSVAASVLLMFWRSNITDTDPRPPLLALAQSGRYDVTVIACWWLTVVALASYCDRPRRRTAFVAGLAAAATTLTQFYGMGIIACVAIALAWRRTRDPAAPCYWREATLGCALPVLLYLAYAGIHWSAFVGQATLRPGRVQFLSAAFYLHNVATEWRRFAWLPTVTPVTLGVGHADLVGSWLVWLALPLVPLTGVQAWRRGMPLVGLSALAAMGSLAALDFSKARIYGSLLVPTLCLALAIALVPARFDRSRPVLRWMRAAAGAGVLVWIVVNGLAGYRFLSEEGPRASRYLDVGARLAGTLESNVTVVGSPRWWWALRDRPYRSLNGVFERWDIIRRAGSQPQFADELSSFGRVFLILDKDTRGDLGRAPIALQTQVRLLLEQRAERVAAWEDRTYGPIEIYRVADARAAGADR